MTLRETLDERPVILRSEARVQHRQHLRPIIGPESRHIEPQPWKDLGSDNAVRRERLGYIGAVFDYSPDHAWSKEFDGDVYPHAGPLIERNLGS